MKLLQILALVGLFLLACNTVEDEGINPAAPVDDNGDVITQVEDDIVQSTDSIAFRNHLADSVSKSWSTSVFTLAGSSSFTSCRLDDVMILFANGTYNYQGGQLCGAEDDQSTRSGSWEINYAEKKIFFDRGSSTEYVAEVIGLSEDELRVKGSYMSMEVRGLYTRN